MTSAGEQRATLVTEADGTLRAPLLESESHFYGLRLWCLDAFPTVDELRRRLREEARCLAEIPADWRRAEVTRNVFLLSCALADAVDDHLAGRRYDFSRAAAWLPGAGRLARLAERLLEARDRYRARRQHALRAWREHWASAQEAVLRAWISAHDDGAALRAATTRLTTLLDGGFASGLGGRRASLPAAFRTQDLTDRDVLALAERFRAAFPDRARRVLVVGLRTAGSFFAPLVRAFLAAHGYDTDAVTLRPKKGVTPSEAAALAGCAGAGGLAVVVDEPPDTGRSLSRAVSLLAEAGLTPADVVLLLPIHPTRPDWNAGPDALPLAGVRTITLAPEEWFKQTLLEPRAVERQMHEYARARGYAAARVLLSPTADHFNRHLRQVSDQKFHTRLKRVFEVRLERHDGGADTRFVLAKSVGWGWLGYHAFVAARALADFVPPLFGLRDGLLYTEWLPGSANRSAAAGERDALVRRIAAYVATRTHSLRLLDDPAPGLDPHHQKGAELLAVALSGAYGWKPAAVLKRGRLRREILRLPNPSPTLIDGRMRRAEWIAAAGTLVKTDFEHHGLGKTELNVTDPAYDLADTILHLALSEREEEMLLREYRERTGDLAVHERLLWHKLLAGTAAVASALDNLKDPRLAHRHAELNRAYIEARDFLTTHMARATGRLCHVAGHTRWTSPLVVLDIDGVLDKQVFGFPSTTAAGIEALSLLHAHGFAIALNTARTLAEAQEYCRDYGCVGAVAEYGSVAWDAVTGRTRVLVTAESRDDLRHAAEALRRVPGVFLNERYEHSLRAYAFEGGRTVPLPTPVVQSVLAPLGLDRVTVHQTYLDTAVLARGTDKGRGLRALLELVPAQGFETIAVGDSEPDLPMFQAASRSFATSHMSRRDVARALGSRIVPASYQPGLRYAARALAHPDGGRCPACRLAEPPRTEGLLWELLDAADRRPVVSLLRTMLDPTVLEAFVR